jgi:hypothetical protein
MYEELEFHHFEEEQKRLIEWENIVDTMDVFPIKSNYAAYKENDKYRRFTEYLKEYVSNLMSGSSYKMPNIDGECSTGRLVATFAGNKYPKNWWDTALRVGNGKKVEKPLPSIDDLEKNTFDWDDQRAKKDNIYAAFMPAYRALKESFDKRPFWQWITNHAQYVAERDSLAALSGLLISLTGETQAEINKALSDYKNAMPSTGRTSEERKAEALRARKEAKAQANTLSNDESLNEENSYVYGEQNQQDGKANDKESTEKEGVNQERVSIEVDLEDADKSINIELPPLDANAMNKSVDSINSQL